MLKRIFTNRISRTTLLLLLPLLCVFITLFIGRYPSNFWQVMGVLIPGVGFPEPDPALHTLVWQMRLPRAVMGAFVGAALAVSGAAFQGVFRNPLVNSGILGVSNGAGFGAALAIVAFGGGLYIYGFSFAFAILAVVLAYFAGRVHGSAPAITLILGGVVVSGVFTALTSILKYLADPYSQLPAITYWLMGSLDGADYKQFTAFIPIIIGMGMIYISRWRINALSMGEKEAVALGVNTGFYKFMIIGGATLSTAAAVSVSGVIGFVGLVIPHIGRMLVGNDNTKLIPVSMSLGACFLILTDVLCRSLFPAEIPIGILTALIGTPFFVYLLKKTKGGGWK
ncbi:MAG: iron ABC transporter permease [Clostridiales bacterium]|nr:iron ABC transporter permease [Clostridiales bacterium]